MASSVENWWADQSKIRFLNLRTRVTMTGIYNPESIRTSQSPEWAEITIPGGADSYYQWINGGALTIPLTLFVNEWGEGRRQRPGYVEEFIKYFQEAMAPKPVTYGGRIVKTAPDVLRLFLGQLTFGEPAPGVNVIVAGLDVDRLVVDKITNLGLSAAIDMDLRRFTFI